MTQADKIVVALVAVSAIFFGVVSALDVFGAFILFVSGEFDHGGWHFLPIGVVTGLVSSACIYHVVRTTRK